MPKSKNRKGHAQKSKQRSLLVKKTNEKRKKEFIEQLNKMQADMQGKKQNAQVVEADEVGDIGDIDNVSLPDEPKKED